MLRLSTRLRRQPTGRPVPALVAAAGLAATAAVAAPHLAAGTLIRQAGSGSGRVVTISAATSTMGCAGTGPLATGLPWDQARPWTRPASRVPGRHHSCWMIRLPMG